MTDVMYRTTSNVRPKDMQGNNEFLASLGLRALSNANNTPGIERSATMNPHGRQSVERNILRDNLKKNQINEVSQYIRELDQRLSVPKFSKVDLNATQQVNSKLRLSVERSNSFENLNRSPRCKQL